MMQLMWRNATNTFPHHLACGCGHPSLREALHALIRIDVAAVVHDAYGANAIVQNRTVVLYGFVRPAKPAVGGCDRNQTHLANLSLHKDVATQDAGSFGDATNSGGVLYIAVWAASLLFRCPYLKWSTGIELLLFIAVLYISSSLSSLYFSVETRFSTFPFTQSFFRLAAWRVSCTSEYPNPVQPLKEPKLTLSLPWVILIILCVLQTNNANQVEWTHIMATLSPPALHSIASVIGLKVVGAWLWRLVPLMSKLQRQESWRLNELMQLLHLLADQHVDRRW